MSEMVTAAQMLNAGWVIFGLGVIVGAVLVLMIAATVGLATEDKPNKEGEK